MAADMTWFGQVGDGDGAVRSASIGLTRGFEPFELAADSRWSFYGEVALSEWFSHDRGQGDRTRFTQIGLTPVVRLRLFDRAYLEAGVGLDLIVPKFLDGERRFGSTFNFGDHVALGTRFGDQDANELSLRAEHFSNAGIKKPNPGINFIEVRYARHF